LGTRVVDDAPIWQTRIAILPQDDIDRDRMDAVAQPDGWAICVRSKLGRAKIFQATPVHAKPKAAARAVRNTESRVRKSFILGSLNLAARVSQYPIPASNEADPVSGRWI
jgi:hypothetical protein